VNERQEDAMALCSVRRVALIGALGIGVLTIGASACVGGGQTPPTTAAPVTSTPSGTVIPAPKPAAPSPSPSPSPSGPEQTHTVETGDTLGSIAQKYYGDPGLWRRIYESNRAAIGEDPDQVKIGTQLRIPPKE
jgi:nucleoid-associated protein YgaU